MITYEECSYEKAYADHQIAASWYTQQAKDAESIGNESQKERLEKLARIVNILASKIPKRKPIVNGTITIKMTLEQLAKRAGTSKSAIKHELNAVRIKTGYFYKLTDYRMDPRLFR